MNISTYDYIYVPEMTGNIEFDVKNLLELNGKKDTYRHVLTVVHMTSRMNSKAGQVERLSR